MPGLQIQTLQGGPRCIAVSDLPFALKDPIARADFGAAKA